MKKPNTLSLGACLIAVLWVCAPLRAQVQTIEDGALNSPMDSGYATQPSSPSGINAELQTRLMRDTNVFNNNAQPSSDFIYQGGALINFWKAQPRWNLALQYRPTFLHYQHESSLDTFDQGLVLTGNYAFTQRFRLQGTETFDSFTGFLPSSSNQYFLLPTVGFTGVNTLIAPTSHDLSNQSEGDLIYQVSPRGSFDLTGSYLLQDFSGIKNLPPGVLSAALLDTNGATGGASYSYRYTQRITLGLRYVYQHFRYGQSGSDQSHTGLITVHWDAAEHVGLDVYGGPSYSTAVGTQFLGGVNEPSAQFSVLSPAFGGTFSLRSDRTVLNVSAEHSVSSGGGLLMTVMSDYEGAEVRHQLTDNWDFVVTGGYNRSVALQSESSKGKVSGETFGTAFERPIVGELSARFEYDYMRQRTNQFVPLGANVNSNQVSVGLFYRIGERRL
ncbi:MAG: hypothetical protein ACRD40_05715 [Candidatus Acidiferrales bacterium]